MNKRTITLLEPWGKQSWKVAYDGPYENDRIPHVEVGSENMAKHGTGEVYELSSLQTRGKAVLWTVIGCANSRSSDGHAHFTVYFAKDAAEAKRRMNEFQ